LLEHDQHVNRNTLKQRIFSCHFSAYLK